MKQLKKRTIALVLASVVTVVGSFAAENYKNCLMALAFKTDNQGAVHVLLETKHSYSKPLNAIKKDANTYIITLPDVNSADSVPIIGELPNVSSVNVRTMPYSTNSGGYTRVTIKTTGSPQLHTYSRIYVPTAAGASLISGYAKQSKPKKEEVVEKTTVTEVSQPRVEQNPIEQQPIAEEKGANVTKNINDSTNKISETNNIIDKDFFEEEKPKQDPTEKLLLVMGILLVIAVAILSYLKAKDKLTQLAGEKIVLDLEEDENKKKKNVKPQKMAVKNNSSVRIKSTIKSLDKKYPKNATMVRKEEYTTPPVVSQQPQEDVKSVEPIVETNVVDLDELFKEQVKSKSAIEEKEEEENAALEDFLSGFSFDEEFFEEELKENDLGYDVELYDSTLNDENLTFNNDDIECISKILNTEIQDSTLRDIEKFAVSNPIKKVPTKKEILEEIASTYAISQNIIFTSDDISALFKLISVELDRDFIDDLRTNPERTKEMYKEMQSSEKSKKPSEILTLNVKDMLPDLSEALKQQGDRKVESNHKTETVYYSEGYDVAKLKISDELPDLTKELAKKDAFASRPTAKYDVVDDSYSVSTLKISDALPNLADAMAHPEKYQAPKKEEFVPDEQAMLKNIANVSFKPFDDGTRQYEVINEDTISYSEQKDYIDFDSPELKQSIEQNETEEAVAKEEDSAKKLLEQIRRRRAERDATSKLTEASSEVKRIEIPAPITVSEESNDNIQCLVDGEAFKVLDSISFTPSSGCHLVKNANGYAVMGFVGDKLHKIKTLESVKVEKIQSRMSEALADGSCRYIVKIGLNKFIVNADINFVEYVMDL